MDPLTAPGLALAAVSLGLQVFSGYEYLRLRLQLEQNRLLDWAVVAGLSADDGDADTAGKMTGAWQWQEPTTMIALQQMKSLLSDLKIMETKFGLTLTQSRGGVDSGSGASAKTALRSKQQRLKKKALDLMAASSACPKRLRWVVFDASKFEMLLSSVTAINDSMVSLLDSRQKQRHYQVQENTFVGVLQLQNRLDDVVQLIESLKAGSLISPERTAVDQRHAQLARFKALNLSVTGEGHRSPSTTQAQLSLDKLRFEHEQESKGDMNNRSCGFYEQEPVWVEWKYYEYSPGAPIIQDRVMRLALLLHRDNTPAEFNTPNCMGYVHNIKDHCVGFVFQSSANLTGSVPITRAIATSLWYLHAVDWLHKGVRSENIVFIDKDDLSAPLLCGFDYSRPIGNGQATDSGMSNRLYDLYRHPDTQFDVPRDGKYGYQKVHDIYSLGVVLFEIGLWECVEAYLGLPPGGDISRPLVKDVKSRLLSSDAEYRLSAEAGEIFAGCAKACLDGCPGSDSSEASNDGGMEVDLEMDVNRKLRSINV